MPRGGAKSKIKKKQKQKQKQSKSRKSNNNSNNNSGNVSDDSNPDANDSTNTNTNTNVNESPATATLTTTTTNDSNEEEKATPSNSQKAKPQIQSQSQSQPKSGGGGMALGKKALLDKYDIRLGPIGYIPGIRGPKSMNISEFSMVDPGGGRELLSDTDIIIGEGNIYGLVGKNGFGKTTLLKLMYTYDIEGFPRHIRMVLVNQEELVTNESILNCVLKADEVRERLIIEEDRLNLMSEQIDEDDEESQEEINQLLQIIWAMHEELSYDMSERRAMKILTGLGFTKKMMSSQKVSDLSGGWQMRVKLAKALFVEPDLMLLDEPTNHLDFPTVLWLANYLQNYHKTVIVVSHDREFLNAVCSNMIHLTQKKLVYFKGNFEIMMKTAKKQTVEQLHAYEALCKQIENIKAWIRKYKDKGENMASAVQSKRKILEQLESEAELLEPPRSEKALQFEFPDVGAIEEFVCRMEEVSFKYKTQTEMLLSNISLQLDTDSRIGMIGANGVGKSTLVKLIMSKIEPLSGECQLNRQARIALFTQYHMDQLNLEQNAIQFLIERFADDADLRAHKDQVGYVRRRLGRFRLTGKQHTQQMKFLSGGQKSRVAFCVATWTKPHFLIMDEPTNHLDMETIDSLIHAIEHFEGGVLVISHDQHFLAKAANEFWAVTPEAIRTFEVFENAKAFALSERIAEVEADDADGKNNNNNSNNRGNKRNRNKKQRRNNENSNENTNNNRGNTNSSKKGKRLTKAEKRLAKKAAKSNQNQVKKKKKKNRNN